MSFPIRIGRSPNLRIRGVIASRNIKSGEIIEICPMIVFPKSQEPDLDKTFLVNYYFEWDKKHDSLLLGYGCLYNHSYNSNAELDEDKKKEMTTITAVKEIKKGEEITINYNGYPNMQTPLDPNYLNFNEYLKK